MKERPDQTAFRLSMMKEMQKETPVHERAKLQMETIEGLKTAEMVWGWQEQQQKERREQNGGMQQQRKAIE